VPRQRGARAHQRGFALSERRGDLRLEPGIGAEPGLLRQDVQPLSQLSLRRLERRRFILLRLRDAGGMQVFRG